MSDDQEISGLEAWLREQLNTIADKEGAALVSHAIECFSELHRNVQTIVESTREGACRLDVAEFAEHVLGIAAAEISKGIHDAAGMISERKKEDERDEPTAF